MVTIHTIGILETASGARFDICRDERGSVHIRVNGGGDEVVASLTLNEARAISDIFGEAAE